MAHDSLFTRDWQSLLEALGGTAALDASARQTKAFQRARGVASACDLLRLILAYCLSKKGLRLTATWASAMGLADISNSLPPRKRGWPCCSVCATAAIGWPCWSVSCSPQAHRPPAAAG